MWKLRERSARDSPVSRFLRLALLALIASVSGPMSASADYVRGELHLNMRTGPGTQYRITHRLKSGDVVTVLEKRDDWERVRTQGDRKGWVPAGFTSREPPAIVALPAARDRLTRVLDEVSTLKTKLGAQSEAVQELESLRAEARRLTLENARLSGSTRAWDLAAGGALLAVGALIGLLTPRGGGRQRKIRL